MPKTSGRTYFKNDSVCNYLEGTAYELLELGRLRSGFEMTTLRVGRRYFPYGMYSAVGVPIFKECQNKIRLRCCYKFDSLINPAVFIVEPKSDLITAVTRSWM
jgi:hypothetical protein